MIFLYVWTIIEKAFLDWILIGSITNLKYYKAISMGLSFSLYCILIYLYQSRNTSDTNWKLNLIWYSCSLKSFWGHEIHKTNIFWSYCTIVSFHRAFYLHFVVCIAGFVLQCPSFLLLESLSCSSRRAPWSGLLSRRWLFLFWHWQSTGLRLRDWRDRGSV